jgi:hypothetical protein
MKLEQIAPDNYGLKFDDHDQACAFAYAFVEERDRLASLPPVESSWIAQDKVESITGTEIERPDPEKLDRVSKIRKAIASYCIDAEHHIADLAREDLELAHKVINNFAHPAVTAASVQAIIEAGGREVSWRVEDRHLLAGVAATMAESLANFKPDAEIINIRPDIAAA